MNYFLGFVLLLSVFVLLCSAKSAEKKDHEDDHDKDDDHEEKKSSEKPEHGEKSSTEKPKHGESDSSDCLHNVKSFIGCLDDKHEKNKGEVITYVEQAKDRITKCFKDNKCTEPEYGADLFANVTGASKAFADDIMKEIKNTPEPVMKCLKHSFRNVTFAKINQCLKSKKVDQIEEDPDNFFDALDGSGNAHTNKSTESHIMLKISFNIIKALQHCKKDHGTKAGNATVECMHTVKEDVKKAVCKQVNSCEKDKLSETCQKRRKEIIHALCGCMKDRLEEIKKSIEKLQDGKDHKTVEIIEVHGKDHSKHMEETSTVIQQCFKNNKMEEPDALRANSISAGFALYTPHDPRGPLEFWKVIIFRIVSEFTGLPKISQEHFSFMHDIVNLMLKDNDCGCD